MDFGIADVLLEAIEKTLASGFEIREGNECHLISHVEFYRKSKIHVSLECPPGALFPVSLSSLTPEQTEALGEMSIWYMPPMDKS